MQPALNTFRIENESVIYLSFKDGREYRVGPSELPQYLHPEEVVKIKKALTLRQQFMKRVLPPTALFMLLVSFGFLAGSGTGMSYVASALGGTYETKVDVDPLRGVYAAAGINEEAPSAPDFNSSVAPSMPALSDPSSPSVAQSGGSPAESQENPAVTRSIAPTPPISKPAANPDASAVADPVVRDLVQNTKQVTTPILEKVLGMPGALLSPRQK